MKTSHIITFYALQILRKGFSSLSARKRFYVASRIGEIFYNYLGLRKDQARANIQRAFPNLNTDKIEKILKNTYLNFCHNFIEFTTLPLSYKNINIKVRGLKKLQSLLDQRKGIVFITGHFGSWEILGPVSYTHLTLPTTYHV